MYKYASGLTLQEVYDHLHSGPRYGLGEHGQGTEHLYANCISLLDVGCGRSTFPSRIKKLHNIPRVEVTDISPVAVDYQRQHFKRPGKVADITDHLPYSAAEFEIITCFDVLEHLPEEGLNRAIEGMARVAERLLVFTIAHIQANNRGPNNELLHLTLQPLSWWHHKLRLITGGKVRTEKYELMKRQKKTGAIRYGTVTLVEL